jgi:lipoyl-dependent peroxiredoxin
VRTSAQLEFEKLDAGWTVTRIHLQTRARVPGADRAAFEKAANDAKAGCPISRLLKAEITLDAQLES